MGAYEEPLPENYNPVDYDEHGNITEVRRMSFWKKCQREPLVPIGCIATVAALVIGVRAFKDGDSARSQRMMRYRVSAQLATILAFTYYTFVKYPRNPTPPAPPAPIN